MLHQMDQCNLLYSWTKISKYEYPIKGVLLDQIKPLWISSNGT